MTKQEAIDSLTTAKSEMEEDPELECVDTLALMEQAIDDAYSYLMLDADTSKPSPETINKELLEALKAALTVIEQDMPRTERNQNREQVIAAIAKAEGI